MLLTLRCSTSRVFSASAGGCVGLNTGSQSGLWYNLDCSTPRHAVCEKPRVGVTAAPTPPLVPPGARCPDDWYEGHFTCFQVILRERRGRERKSEREREREREGGREGWRVEERNGERREREGGRHRQRERERAKRGRVGGRKRGRREREIGRERKDTERPREGGRGKERGGGVEQE